MPKRAKKSNKFKSFQYEGSKKLLLLVLGTLLFLILLPVLWIKYENAQIEKVFSNAIGSNWLEVSREEFGNSVCFTSCYGQTRTYSTPVNYENAMNIFSEGIKKSNFNIVEKSDSCTVGVFIEDTTTICYVRGKKGDLYLTFSLNVENNNQNVSVRFGHDSYFFGLIKE